MTRPSEGLAWWEKVGFLARLRRRLRMGFVHVRGGWWQILQTAVAAGAAWVLASLILRHEEPPVFASIAAVISLGLAVGRRLRRTVALLAGVAFGVVIADLVVVVFGIGAPQMGLLVALAMVVTTFFFEGEELAVNEAAISAMILTVAFYPSEAGFPLARLSEALVGGCTALLVNALLPIDPERMVRTAAHPVFDESIAVLEETAAALDDGDFERAQKALAKARAIDDRVRGFKEALAAGRETARIAPPRRRALGHLELYAAAADQIDLTVRHVRILARDALGVVRTGHPAPEPLAVALRDLARATEALAAYLETPDSPEEARRLALKAAEGAAGLLRDREDLAQDLATNALVDEIFSAAYDLLLGTGMDPAAALWVLKEAVGHPLEPS
jgi:Fusaric acid resistance protein-like